MKIINMLIFLLFYKTAISQVVLEKYPEDQSPFKNGTKEMFAELQNYFVTNQIKPCTKKEIIIITLKVDETGRPFLIKKASYQKNIESNKCAFELAEKALASLRNWQPAEVNGKKVSAYYDFPFNPNDFFENYKEGYDATDNYKLPEFPGGNSAFRQKLNKNLTGYIDWSTIKDQLTVMIHFNIDEKGKMSNVEVESKIPNSYYLHEDIKYCVQKIKDTWAPALYENKPINFKYRIKYKLEVDYFSAD